LDKVLRFKLGALALRRSIGSVESRRFGRPQSNASLDNLICAAPIGQRIGRSSGSDAQHPVDENPPHPDLLRRTESRLARNLFWTERPPAHSRCPA
jgi:hypothetical protein